MHPGEPLDWIDDELAAWRAAGLDRRLRDVRRTAPGRIEIDGRTLVDFGSNDYLGLACDARLAAAASEEADAGAAASPLIAGHTEDHARLEAALARFEGTEGTLMFSSGYAANVGTIAALVERGDAVFSDELNHASLIDGCRLSRAQTYVYPHGDTETLAGMLAECRARRKLIVTDGLFSMDGDVAPLVELAVLRRRFGAMLLVDEAHATGVLGTGGRGAAELADVSEQVDVRVGTLSKALGAAGGFVAGRRGLVDWLVNRARPYVFSTALPAAACRAARAALAIVGEEPQRRRDLLQRAVELRAALAAQGWDTGPSASQIVPVIVGRPDETLALAEALFERGLFVPAIRPPSVPPGGSRLRISLSFAHGPEEVGRLAKALGELAQRQRAVGDGRAAHMSR